MSLQILQLRYNDISIHYNVASERHRKELSLESKRYISYVYEGIVYNVPSKPTNTFLLFENNLKEDSAVYFYILPDDRILFLHISCIVDSTQKRYHFCQKCEVMLPVERAFQSF
jgi:hypothetical protein